MNTIRFIVNGPAVPLARPRILKCGRAFLPKRSSDYKKLIQLTALKTIETLEKKTRQKWTQLSNAVTIEIKERRRIPSSWTKKKKAEALNGQIPATSRPDLDNIVKAVFDALNGIVWTDDAQITSLTALKEYSATPRLEVTIRGS